MRDRRIAKFSGPLLAVLIALSTTQSLAQDSPPPPPAEVSGPEISMLIRTTMVALHQANLTGNYTVLRDLGASVLRASNTAADLASLFTGFRNTRLNLAPTVLFDAVMDKKPELSTNGVLKLTGHFPTKPEEIVFDMTFSYELGAWRIAILNVGTRVAVAQLDVPPSPENAAPKADPMLDNELIPPTPRVRPHK